MEKTAEQLRREHIALEGDTHGKNKWAILFTVLIMTFMVCLDSTVVTVALPVMQKELGVGLDRIQLVSSVYLLATCVAMLPFGRLGDVRGKVNVFQLGVIVFSVGSLLCGLSASLEVLILARIVQGVGCAAAMANNMGIITESFPARERGRAMGILATFVALGMMCGPVLGGMLVASFPWESIFLINLPIGVISFIVGLYTLPHVKPEAGERPMSLIEAARRCFANSAFTINLACMLIVFVGIGASEFILPFYFQDAHGFGSDISGLLFLALPMVNAFIGPLSGTVSDRVGCEGPTAVGLGVYVCGLFAVSTLDERSSIPVIVCCVAFMSCGTSIFQSPNNSLYMGSAPREALGFAGSLGSLARYAGMALGITAGVAYPVWADERGDGRGRDQFCCRPSGCIPIRLSLGVLCAYGCGRCGLCARHGAFGEDARPPLACWEAVCHDSRRPKKTGLWCDAACGAGGGRSVVDYRTTFINRAVSLPREGVAPCRSLRIVFAMTAS